MAEELRLVLIVLGVLGISALALHGWWTVRKNNKDSSNYDVEASASSASRGDGFDELGIGRKRVLQPGEKPQPKPTPTVAPKANKLREPVKVRREPELNDSALDMGSFSATDEPYAEAVAEEQQAAYDAEKNQTAQAPANEVLILYVLLPEGEEINGSLLLPLLLTLGFKYGEMNIFHRFQDNAGSGEVLFSLANMFNPGTFDLEEMEKMNTRGLSLFMTLPGPGEALQNFNLMHSAAKKLADEFGGQVLDGQRSVLTVQTVRHYVEKIREFQRQRLIHG
ncbi:cell division protein ZipA [Rheinheimera sediminis]|uniref:cell division protein ZipA n=1 Tax=Rheinheimera sp. YQF-1 TaxID=2499626 RepID=UPI000FD824D7|nr:cell division protein ZipA [Rheinheimera sp. YQF-1]RVT46488.1 cell division protein ZipA [Rheinheimera sp. YQF-1]